MALTVCVSLGISAIGFYSTLGGPPATFVQLSNVFPVGGFPIFKEDSQVLMNTFIRNIGGEPAMNVLWDASLEIHQKDLSPSTEDEMWREFMERPRRNYPQGDLGIGQEFWRTPATLPLKNLQLQELIEGKTALYLLLFIHYRDSKGAHEYQYCAFLQPPGNSPVWRTCHGHNRIG